MNLRDFVADSLVQIVRGVEDASKQMTNSTAIISPSGIRGLSADTSGASIGYLRKDAPRRVDLVEFDVGVYAAEGQESKGGLGIIVGSFAIGRQNAADGSFGSQSRIRFGVPLVLPTGDNRSVV